MAFRVISADYRKCGREVEKLSRTLIALQTQGNTNWSVRLPKLRGSDKPSIIGLIPLNVSILEVKVTRRN